MRLERYVMHADGDGVVFVRLSSRDIQEGETAFGQVRTVLEMCDRNRLRPRWILASNAELHVEGALRESDPLGLGLWRDADEGWLSGVAARGDDRISRNPSASPLFPDELQRRKIGFWLDNLGGYANLEGPVVRFMLRSLGSNATLERDRTVDRATAAIISRWLDEKRGWPPQPKYGFRRDHERFLEVDPDA